MDEMLFPFHHPLTFILAMSFVATLLAALAWGKSGVIAGIAAGPAWGVMAAVVSVLTSKPPLVAREHLNFVEVAKAILLGTAVWLLAAIPGLMMGLAIRALKRGQPQIQEGPPA
jgi:hypothetical protein